MARLGPMLAPRAAATARENLRLVYGEADPALLRRVYRHFAEAAVDCVYFRRLFRPDRFDRHFELAGPGWEHFRRLKPHGSVLVTGHFGNWELYGAAFGHAGIRVTPVGRAPERHWFATRLDRFRRSLGVETIEKENALPLAMKALRRGAAVAFLNDQAAGRHGIALPFLGLPAHTFLAPAALAAKFQVPLYAGYSTRVGDGIRYRCWSEPVEPGPTVEETTLRCNEILGGYVRACPEQWWWFHRRFKPPRAERRGLPLTPAGLPVAE